MFHLLTVFPNSTAEHERYYVTNMLKKPQWVSICQFVQRVEQLNSYITQLPCWYYSPCAKPSTIPMKVPFAEADLASHVLWMCPHPWQDQFNLHKKGMTPMGIHLLLLPLKAIELVCTQERSNAQPNKKSSHKGEKGNMTPGTKYTGKVQARFPRKLAPRCIVTAARSMGACTPHTTPRIFIGTRKTERKNLISLRPRCQYRFSASYCSQCC